MKKFNVSVCSKRRHDETATLVIKGPMAVIEKILNEMDQPYKLKLGYFPIPVMCKRGKIQNVMKDYFYCWMLRIASNRRKAPARLSSFHRLYRGF